MIISTPKQLVRELKNHGTLKAVMRASGMSWSVIHKLYVAALELELLEPLKQGAPSREDRTDRIKPRKGGGRVKVKKATELDVKPDKRGVRRYIFTSAQCNTKLHERFWQNLCAFADHLGARICVSRFTYNKRWHQDMDKSHWGAPATDKASEWWWDNRLVPYLVDDRVQVAPGLVWCGEMNILPTAVRPLSGLESYTGRQSGIFPHAKLAMESIAAGKYEPTKFNYTTGTITQRNYIQRKQGLKAQFHHVYGALLVEVNEDGDWWVRQLNADSTGTFYDLDRRVKDGEVTYGHRVDLVLGDIHVDQIDTTVQETIWGEGGMIDRLNPKTVVLHDVLDGYRFNHHEAKNVHTRFRRYVEKKTCIADELRGVHDFFKDVARPGVQYVVADSNHHDFLGRWLREQDGLQDPSNAEIWLRAQSLLFEYVRKNAEEPNYLRLAMDAVGESKTERKFGVRFLDADESFILAPDEHGGIECGMHGHAGPNGSRGSPRNLARLGRRACTGHTHSAGIYDGVYTAGCCCILDPHYVRGPSSWSHTQIGVYPNGKRTMLTIWKGRAWA